MRASHCGGHLNFPWSEMHAQGQHIGDAFFGALERVRGIHGNCRSLLRTTHQRAGLELMDLMSSYQETAYEHLCRLQLLPSLSFACVVVPVVWCNYSAHKSGIYHEPIKQGTVFKHLCRWALKAAHTNASSIQGNNCTAVLKIDVLKQLASACIHRHAAVLMSHDATSPSLGAYQQSAVLCTPDEGVHST